MNRKLYHIILLLLTGYLSGGASIMGQTNPIDSLDQLLKGLSDSAKIDQIYSMLSESGNNSLESSLLMADKAIEVANQMQDQEALSDAYKKKGIIYSNALLYQDALDFYQKSLDIKKKIQDSIGLGHIYHDLAVVHFSLHDTLESLTYFTLALKISEAMNNNPSLGIRELNLAEFYFKTGKPDEAKNHYLKSLAILKGSKDYYNQIQVLLALGKIEETNLQYNHAKEYFVEATKYAKEHQASKELATIGYYMGGLFLNMAKSELALVHLENALKITNGLDICELKANILLEMSRLYQKKRNKGKAYRYYLHYSQLQDSIKNENREKQLSFLNMKYDSDHKKNEVNLLLKENQLRTEKLNKQKRIQQYSWIIVFFFVIATVISFRLLIIRRRTFKLLNEKSHQLMATNEELISSEKSLKTLNDTKNKLFAILAENLFQPFVELVDLAVSLDSKSENLNTEEIKLYSKRIYHSSKDIHGLLESLLHWSRLQTKKVVPHPESSDLTRLAELILSEIRVNAERKQIRVETNLATSCKISVDPNHIMIALRNIFQNAIKYTPDYGLIKVQTSCDQNIAHIQITDSGMGISEEDQQKLFRTDQHFTIKGTAEEKGIGLGLIIAKEFITLNDGKIELNSKPGKGSIFSITFPLLPSQDQD